MEKIIKDALLDLGCSEKEAKFFITNYTIGSASINELAKKSRIERSTSYVIADRLLAKGLILEDFKRYKKQLITVEPKVLLRMLAAKQRQVGRHEIAMQENLPQLQSLYQASEIRPRVQTFEGKKGLLTIRQDLLSSQQELLLWTNQETERQFFSEEYHKLFVQERIKRNIPIRVLAVNNKEGKQLAKSASSLLRQVKLLPAQTTFSAETYIYGNKVAILDYNKDIIGVILESEQLAGSQRAIFEMTWTQLD